MNECRFIGRLSKDPEIKCTSSGSVRAYFSIAVGREYVDSSGEKREFTDWVNIIAWGKLAEAVGNVLHKGSRVFVNCRYSTRSYEDGSGVKKYVHEFIANSISFSIYDIQKINEKNNEKSDSNFTQFGDVKENNSEEIPF